MQFLHYPFIEDIDINLLTMSTNRHTEAIGLLWIIHKKMLKHHSASTRQHDVGGGGLSRRRRAVLGTFVTREVRLVRQSLDVFDEEEDNSRTEVNTVATLIHEFTSVTDPTISQVVILSDSLLNIQRLRWTSLYDRRIPA